MSGAPPPSRRPDRPGWRERVLGGRDRLGWWLLPLFVMVGLGGAVLAGSLVVVYYAQQVNQLEAETRSAREDLVGAAEEVRETADEALEAINEEARAVREELARGLPLADALEVGVVRLEVDTELEVAAEPVGGVRPAAAGRTPLATGQQAPEDSDDDPEGDGDGGTGGEEPDDAQEGEPDEGQAPAEDGDPPEDEGSPDDGPSRAPRTERVPFRRQATGFVVVADDEDTAFLATSLGFLDDPRTDERVPADVEVTVRLPAGTTTASVHSWDEEHDLLLLRAEIGNVEPLPWLDEDDEVAPGDRLVAIGTTPGLEVVRVGSEVAAVTPRAVVTTQPALQLVDGGPVVNLDGEVVGVATAEHVPLGGDPLVVPIRRLCDGLLSRCPE